MVDRKVSMPSRIRDKPSSKARSWAASRAGRGEGSTQFRIRLAVPIDDLAEGRSEILFEMLVSRARCRALLNEVAQMPGSSTIVSGFSAPVRPVPASAAQRDQPSGR